MFVSLSLTSITSLRAHSLISMVRLRDGEVLGHNLSLVLSMVLHISLGHILGCVDGTINRLVRDLGLVLGQVLGLGDVLWYQIGLSNVRRMVVSVVMCLVLRDVLDLGFVNALRDVLGDVLGQVHCVVLGAVLGVVQGGWDVLLLVDGLVDRNLRRRIS